MSEQKDLWLLQGSLNMNEKSGLALKEEMEGIIRDILDKFNYGYGEYDLSYSNTRTSHNLDFMVGDDYYTISLFEQDQYDSYTQLYDDIIGFLNLCEGSYRVGDAEVGILSFPITRQEFDSYLEEFISYDVNHRISNNDKLMRLLSNMGLKD